MKKISILLLLTFTACSNQKEKEWQIIKNFNNVGLEIQRDDIVIVDTEVCISLYFKNNNYHIKQAYGGCDFPNIKSINKSENKINECAQKLYIKDDTIKLCLRPVELGHFIFPNITVLFSDNENNYFIADTTLSCEVKP